jgi:leucine dehydrogenase
VAALRCRLVVGAANNQLAADGVAAELAARGIVWVPDFLANAGGLLYAVTLSREDITAEQALARVAGLGETALEVLRRAEAENTTTLQAAIRLADERIAAESLTDSSSTT